MATSFIHSFQSEWLKTRRSLASGLVILGSFLIPFIMFIVRIVYSSKLSKDTVKVDFWATIFENCWNSMAIFLLPIGIVLVTSLIAQLEFRNNTWKQLHTTPQYLTTIFFAKLLVILLMLAQLFILFNIGIYLAGVVPHLIFNVSLPQEPFPWNFFLTKNAYFFLDCLPIIALQYLLSLQFKNFLVPLSIGLGFLIACLIATQWHYNYIMPYSYCTLTFMSLGKTNPTLYDGVHIHLWALGYFIVFGIASYVFYLFQKEKG
jgi:lantibiotic transport system permease protein